jgi:hypothetical protein
MNVVDITFTVTEKDANGRRLLKELEGGNTYWVPAEPSAEPVKSTKVKATKTHAKKQVEGDK